VLSESKPLEVPHIDFYEQLDPFNDTLVLFNNGGEPVPIKEFKLVMQSGSTEYFINGEELSSKLIEEYGDNGYWDLGEYISINVSEMCSLDLENCDEDLTVFFIHTPSKQVIQKSFVPCIYLDDDYLTPNDRIPRDWYTGGSIWIPPQLLALDNSVRPQNGNKPDLIGSACLDDVQKIGGGFTTYYPNEEASMYEYFEFGLNESVLNDFGVTFSDYENLNISGVKIKVDYKGHDGSFKWVKLRVWDQTEGIFYNYTIPEYHSGKGNSQWGSEIVELPHITNATDLENLNVSIIAEGNHGQSAQHYINVDYIAVYIPSSSEISPQENLIHIGNVNVTTSAKKDGDKTKVTTIAVLTILDSNNNPVKDAKVSGYWSGAYSDTFSDQKTDDEGTVEVKWENKSQEPVTTLTFTCNVNDVTHSSYTWDKNPKSGTVVYQNTPPLADAGGPYNIQVGQSVTFDGSNSNDPDGDPIEYLWDFGDGKDSKEVAPEHKYSAAGTYYVTLTVTDDKRVTDTDVATVVVTDASQGNLIHIGSVNVTTSINDGKKVTATAVVTILDSNNAPVKGAEVSGSWSGAAIKTFDKEKTGDKGTVTLELKDVEYGVNPLKFTFNVTDVTLASYTWDENKVSKTVEYTQEKIHIGSVNITTDINNGGKKVTATAVVTILDSNNVPVKDAKISGYWSGAASDTFKDQNTDDKGTVTLDLKNVDYNSGTLTFTFTVNGVTHSSYTWDNITKNETVKYP